MYRFLRAIFEFIIGFVGVLIVLGALLVWRLSAAPISSTFLTPYIVTGIESLIPGAHATISGSVLTWDNADRSVEIHADDLHLAGPDGTAIADVPSFDISASAVGLLLGRLVPSGLTIEHPQVKLTRASDGSLYFGGMPSGSGDSSGNLKGTLANVADNAAHAFFMHKLQLTRAVFDVHDEKNDSDWSISIPEIILQRMGGDLAGEAKIEVTQKDQLSVLSVHYAYDREHEQHNMVIRFSSINPSFFVGGNAGSLKKIFNLPLTGEISVGLDEKFKVVAGSLDIHGDPGTFDDPDFWDQPRAVQSLDLKATYDQATRKLDVPTANIDFGGPTLAMTLTGTPTVAEIGKSSHDLDFVLGIKLDNVPMKDYASLWPKPIISDVRDWIAANLLKGKFDHAEGTFKGSLSWNDLNSIDMTEGSGKISASGAEVHYLDGMPPVENAKAEGTFDLSHIAIQATGNIGDLQLQPSTIVIGNFQGDPQTIELPLHISGPIPSLMRLIDSPPLGYARAVGLKPDEIDGVVDGTLTMNFPLLKDLKMSDIAIKADAALADVASSKLLAGYDISQGDWQMTLEKTGFSLKGPVAINKVPVQVEWHEFFAPAADKPMREATVTGDIDGDGWAQLGVASFAKTKGPISVTLQMEQKDKALSVFAGMLDMNKAEMHVDEIGWSKPAASAAKLTFTADVPNEGKVTIKSLEMTGPKISVKGDATLAANTHALETINLDPFIVGRTDAHLHFAQTAGDDGSLRFDVDGKSLDISGLHVDKDGDNKDAEKKTAPADQRPKEYHIKIDKLYTSDTGYMTDAKGYAVRDGDGWSAINFHGLANGGPPLDIELVTKDDGHRIFAVNCEDFGMALKGLGFTDTVMGGKLQITGASTADKPELIEGKAEVGHFEVKDLPALVTLMNATSPFGIFNLFTGTMAFDRLSGKFRWGDDQVELIQVRAAGSSVGMNIDGKVDTNAGTANLHGTMAPFSLFNKVLGYIPIIGNMLTGGENQGVLAVNYTITGTLNKPDVSVNPVSLLAPGFLRTLFFGGSSGSDDDTSAAPVDDGLDAKDQAPPVENNISRAPKD